MSADKQMPEVRCARDESVYQAVTRGFGPDARIFLSGAPPGWEPIGTAKVRSGDPAFTVWRQVSP